MIVDDITRTSATVNSLSPGTWYVAVRAVNTAGTESGNSNVSTKSVAGATAAKSLAITVSTSAATSYKTVSENVWDVRKRTDGVWARIGVVGTIALGKPCSTSFKVGDHHYLVNRSDVTLTKKPASTQLVVYCEKK
jgi:hypothetical protein